MEITKVKHETFNEKAKAAWTEAIQKKGISSMFDSLTFTRIMRKEKPQIQAAIEEGNICTPSIGDMHGGMTNYFVINDYTHGEVCEKCGTSGVVVLLMDPDFTENLDKKVFLPGADNYEARNILIENNEFSKTFPVPVNSDTDYWWCCNCDELHRFNYDQENGLIYDQGVVDM